MKCMLSFAEKVNLIDYTKCCEIKLEDFWCMG